MDGLLTDPSFFDDPYPVYEKLRNSAPVYWSESWGQWVVTRREDVMGILRDPETFSSVGYEAQLLQRLKGSPGSEFPELSRHYRASVLSRSDPPLHTRLRRMLLDRFTKGFLEGYKPRVRAIVDEQVKRLDGLTEFDFAKDYAYPIPALVIAEMIGLPDSLRDPVVDWSKDITAFVGTGAPSLDRAHRADQSLGEFHEALELLMEERRMRPENDLMSLLLDRGEDQDRLDAEETIATCVTLLFAGHETTANALSNALLALLTHPAQLAAIRREPALIEAAVEELLRFDNSVQRVRRTVRRDVEMHGHTLREGDLVMAFIAAANRDPESIEDPDELQVGRSPNRHLSFGQGIHLCIGAPLARIELPIALDAFLQRFPHVRLHPSRRPVRPQNITFRQVDSLYVAVG